MSLNNWAAGIQRDVYEYWKEEHPQYERGFNVFLSPIVENPRLLIVGYQPGGDKSDFESFADEFRSGDFSPPSQHEFLNAKYSLAKNMRNKLFADNRELLEESVALNSIFFMAPDMATWKEVPEEQRAEMESFCFDKLDEVIDRLEPDNILFFGMETWKMLAPRYGFEVGEEFLRPNTESNHRLMRISKSESPRYMGICHPTGQMPVSDTEFEQATNIITSHLV